MDREKRYLNLGLTYLIVVIIHGAWNALAVLNIYSTAIFSQTNPAQYTGLVWIGTAAPYFLVGSALVMFALLLWMNAKLRRGEVPASEPTNAIPPDASQDSEPTEVML